jgi:hypothetical protein
MIIQNEGIFLHIETIHKELVELKDKQDEYRRKGNEAFQKEILYMNNIIKLWSEIKR